MLKYIVSLKFFGYLFLKKNYIKKNKFFFTQVKG